MKSFDLLLIRYGINYLVMGNFDLVIGNIN